MPQTQDSRESSRYAKASLGVAPCERCGVEFPKRRSQARFCSRACQEKQLKQAACEACGAPFVGTRFRRYCSAECRATCRPRRDREPAHFQCKGCGKAFTPKGEPREDRPPRFCSKTCGLKAIVSAKLERRKLKEIEEEKAKRSLPSIACPSCGQRFQQTASRKKYCSADCQLRRFNKGSLLFQSKAKPPIAARCQECDKPFRAPDRYKNRIRFCSGPCRKKMAKRTRKALKRNAFVEAVGLGFLINRDGGFCQICNQPVDQSAVAPNPRSPTIDHVIPLSKGGVHSKANTQLACFLCNSIKGDSII